MNDYRSLYTWAMERQMALREEAEQRRMARAPRDGNGPAPARPRLRLLPGARELKEPATQKSA
jgi:hypothetical protein